jgi:hypothetical protein
VPASDNPLDVVRAELGEPDAVYHVSPGRFWAKAGVGLALVGYGAAANYLWWAHGPQRFDHAAFLLLVVPPLTGLSLLGHVWRTWGLHVLAYPTGLLRVQAGEAESYPWAEVDEVRLTADQGTIRYDRDGSGELAGCWVAVDPPAFRLWSAGLTVRRADGVSAKLTPAVAGYADLAERVQRATFRYLWGPAWAAVRAGEAVGFGPFEATAAGLRHGKDVLPWAAVGEVAVAAKAVTVKKKGAWLTWASKELDEVPNPHVLLGVIAEAKRTARAAGP